MSDLLKESKPVARRDYHCDACQWWDRSGYTPEDCDTEEQRRAVIAANKDRYKILKGQKYIKQVIVDCGDFETYRARPDMHKVCIELDLFDA